jgi:hypothetical protein
MDICDFIAAQRARRAAWRRRFEDLAGRMLEHREMPV